MARILILGSVNLTNPVVAAIRSKHPTMDILAMPPKKLNPFELPEGIGTIVAVCSGATGRSLGDTMTRIKTGGLFSFLLSVDEAQLPKDLESCPFDGKFFGNAGLTALVEMAATTAV